MVLLGLGSRDLEKSIIASLYAILVAPMPEICRRESRTLVQSHWGQKSVLRVYRPIALVLRATTPCVSLPYSLHRGKRPSSFCRLL